MLDDGNSLGRRKPVRRTPAERSAIVAETYQPGATVAGVAQRHGIVASQLSSWRTVAKSQSDQDKRHGSDFAAITVMADALAVPFMSTGIAGSNATTCQNGFSIRADAFEEVLG